MRKNAENSNSPASGRCRSGFGSSTKTKSETVKAEYCPMPSEKEECSKVEITRLIFAEPALTAFADSLLHNSLELKLANFSSSHVRKKLKKEVDETKDDDGKYLRLEQDADNALYGYSPDYLTIRTGYWGLRRWSAR